jgi:hypothetical protein
MGSPIYMLATVPPSVVIPGFVSSTFSWNSGYSGTTSPAINTTGATLLIIVGVASSGGSLVTPSDSQSNTYHAVFATPPSNPTANTYMQIWVAYAPTNSASMTWTTPSGMTCAFSAWNNTQTTAAVIDTSVQNYGTFAAGSTSAQAGSVTPSQTNELLIAAIGYSTTTNSWTINDGFTEPTQTQAFSPPMIFAYLIDSSSAPISPTWTIVANTESGLALIAGFLHP